MLINILSIAMAICTKTATKNSRTPEILNRVKYIKISKISQQIPNIEIKIKATFIKRSAFSGIKVPICG